MRNVALLVSFVGAVAFSTSAYAAHKVHHHHHHHKAAAAAEQTVGSTGGMPGMDATEDQRAAFFRDALFPMGAK